MLDARPPATLRQCDAKLSCVDVVVLDRCAAASAAVASDWARIHWVILLHDVDFGGHSSAGEPSVDDAKNELNSPCVVLFGNSIFFLRRQHELFNDPRLSAFMQMEGLINTKTVA